VGLKKRSGIGLRYLNVILGVSPVALGVHVSEVEAVLLAEVNVGNSAGDLAGDEGDTPPWALVVEEDTVAGEHVVSLTVVLDDPEAVQLGHT